MGVVELVSRSDLLRGLVSVAAAAGSVRAGAAISVVGQPRVPAITGPHPHVGVKTMRVGGARVKVFYPAQNPSSTEATYCTDGRATSDGMAGLVGFRQLGCSFLLGHLANAPSGCTLDAPPLAEHQALPLLVYSHGFGGNMDMATYLMRELASHGLVVAAVEHTDGTASFTTLEDGSSLPFSPGILSARDQLKRRADELLAAAAPDALGSGLPAIDASKVWLGGHSYGGPSALLASALVPEGTCIAGLLLHDPALGMSAGIDAALRGGRDTGLPILSYVSDEYDRAGVRCGATVHTIGGFHGNFVDAPLWAPLWVMRPLSALIPAAGPVDPCLMHAELARTASAVLQTGTRAEASATIPTAASSSRLLELRGGLSAGPLGSVPEDPGVPASSSSSSSPAAVMQSWRQARLDRFAGDFDASRYHAQVLFIDDDGARAKACEALLERVALWSDAGWWIYPHAASTSNNVKDGDRSQPSLVATAATLGLCKTRLSAPAATLDPEDLLSYDLICCVDYTTLELVLEMARDMEGSGDLNAGPTPEVAGSGGDDATPAVPGPVPSATIADRVMVLTDFLAYQSERIEYADRMATLDAELQSLLARHYASATALTDLPSAVPSDPAAWERFLAGAALGCAGLTSFLKEQIDLWFVASFLELLDVIYGTVERVDGVEWVEAEEVLRRHIVTGGLRPEERQRLWTEHCQRVLGARSSDPD